MDTLEKPSEASPAVGSAAERLGIADTPEVNEILKSLVVAVAMYKGGVGKTELSKELAWLLNAVMVDFDWDGGNVTRAWGYRHETKAKAPLLDAMEVGRVPRPLTGGPFRADLVPSHPDFGDNQPETEYITGQLEQWSQAWQRPIVIDTHPGGGNAAYGAISAANVTVVPVLLENRPLAALEGMADELRSFNLVIVPNRISAAPRAQVDRLKHISETYGIPVGPTIGNYSWLSQRQLRMAVSARRPIPQRNHQFVEEITAVAKFILNYAAREAHKEDAAS